MKPSARTCCFCLKPRGVMPYTVALRALGIAHADYAHDRCLRRERAAFEAATMQANAEARERFGAITIDNAADAMRWKRARVAELWRTR